MTNTDRTPVSEFGPCPGCGGPVATLGDCQTWPSTQPDGTTRWMACMGCYSALNIYCEANDGDGGHNPRNPRYADHEKDRPEWLKEAALPALRKQWAEEAAAKADQIAEGHQKSAVEHRRISHEVGSTEPKGQRHMRTALAFKERAAGAWEAAHAVREYGEGS